MLLEFEIVKIFFHHNRGHFIFVKYLGENDDFEVANGAVFGDIPIYHYKELQPIVENEDKSQTKYFVFRPTSLKWFPEGHFKVGQHVTLATPD